MSFQGVTRRTLLKAGAAGLASTALPFGAIRQAAAAGEVIVGVVYVGPRDDFGWNQAHAVSIELLKQVPNVKVVEEENVPETDAVRQVDGIDDQPRRRQPDPRHVLRLLLAVHAGSRQEISRTSSSATQRRCGARTRIRRTWGAISPI